MPDRTRLLKALETMPDEAFGWFVMATCSVNFGRVNARIWPDGIGGFTPKSRASIIEIRAAADEYLDSARG